jgi:hypothetical protein
MRASCIVVVAAAFASAATAQPMTPDSPPNPLDGVFLCANATDDSARLACYDDAVAQLRQGASSGQIVALDRDHVQEMERDSFGFTLPSLSRVLPTLGSSNRLEAVELQLERIAPRAGGRVAFIMSDGQIWVQSETQRISNLRVGDVVRVRQAALGGFMMSSPRGGAPYRVRREN